MGCRMSNEELSTPEENEVKKPKSWDWIWPSIVGLIIVKLFGLAGGFVTIGAYYFLKPKLGYWAVAASGVIGSATAFGLGFMLGIVFPTQTTAESTTVPVAATQHATTVPSTVGSQQEQQQNLLLVAAKEIISKYPQLDTESAAKDQSAIDYVVSRRDAYIANGQQVDIALRMAANDYGEQLRASQQSEAEKRYAQQVSSYRFNQPSVSQPSAASNDYIRRKSEGCQPKAVMTDEEIARCRGR